MPYHSGRTPILSVFIERPQANSFGAIACIRVGFRYWCNETNQLGYFGDSQFIHPKKLALGNFYLRYPISGDRPERGQEDYCPEIEYSNVFRLSNEDHVKAMARTLLHFKAKLRPLGSAMPYPHFSRYIEEAANILKIKEAVFEDGDVKVPLSDALQRITETAWRMRQRCLILQRHQSLEGYAKAWCDRNGYTHLERADGEWWAIPPGAEIPTPIESALNS